MNISRRARPGFVCGRRIARLASSVIFHLLITQIQAYQKCCVCSGKNVNEGEECEKDITIEDQLIPLPVGLPGFLPSEATCRQLKRAGEKTKVIPEFLCPLFDRDDFREACGCAVPTPQPTTAPTLTPSKSPTQSPSASPSSPGPSAFPTTSPPTVTPSSNPTRAPNTRFPIATPPRNFPCCVCGDNCISQVTQRDREPPLPMPGLNANATCYDVQVYAEDIRGVSDQLCDAYDWVSFRLVCGCARPTRAPTVETIVTQAPVVFPTTANPTSEPSEEPSTVQPSTSAPPEMPSTVPPSTSAPLLEPSTVPPTSVPYMEPSAAMSSGPSMEPSGTPSSMPSAAPSYSDSPVNTNNDCQIEFVMWDADSNTVVGLLQNQLNEDGVFCIPEYSINFEVRPSEACNDDDEGILVESAYLTLDGPTGDTTTSKKENLAPYTLFGDDEDTGDINPGPSLEEGVYTIAADFFEFNSLQGNLVLFGDFQFRAVVVCDDEETDNGNVTTNNNDICMIEFILWDADSSTEIGILQETECLRPNGAQFNIEARPTSNCPIAKSADLQLEGPISSDRLENITPFTVLGDDYSTGEIFGEEYMEGSYTIYTKVYSEYFLGGNPIVERSFSFAISGVCRRANRKLV